MLELVCFEFAVIQLEMVVETVHGEITLATVWTHVGPQSRVHVHVVDEHVLAVEALLTELTLVVPHAGVQLHVSGERASGRELFPTDQTYKGHGAAAAAGTNYPRHVIQATQFITGHVRVFRMYPSGSLVLSREVGWLVTYTKKCHSYKTRDTLQGSCFSLITHIIGTRNKKKIIKKWIIGIKLFIEENLIDYYTFIKQTILKQYYPFCLEIIHILRYHNIAH